MADSPVVLRPISLLRLLEYVLELHATPTTIVICSSRELFLRNLLLSIEIEPQSEISLNIFSPALQLLKSSRTVNMAFCPSVPALHAWLCSHASRGLRNSNNELETDINLKIDDSSKRVPMLVIVDPIALHREAYSFSAQGLSRAFAAMVETASKTNKRLIIAECPVLTGHDGVRPRTAAIDDVNEEEVTAEASSSHQGYVHSDPWDEDVSILNVTTKSFGVGERGWVGRTVKIGQVAERWCRFEAPPPYQHRD